MATARKRASKSEAAEEAKGVDLPQTPNPGVVALPDSAFLQSCSTAEKKAGKKGYITDVNSESIPFPSFCLQYLTHLTGFPLRRVVVVVGQKASYKSTFVGEVCRWFRWGGGGGVLVETERKLQRTLINAVTAYDKSTCQMKQVTSQDAAQALIDSYISQFKRDTPNKDVPGLYCVDSIAAAQRESTQKSIDDAGFATGQRYATEAASNKDWLNRITAKTLDWPISYLLVNHVAHQKIEGQMFGVERKSPGGKHIGYQEALELEFSRIGTKDKPVKNPFSLELYMKSSADDLGFHEVPLSIAVYKNSDGAGARRIRVNAYYWYTKEVTASGRVIPKLWFTFDWHSSTVNLLLGGEKMPKSKAADIRTVASGGGRPTTYWTPVLGMTKDDAVLAHELGAMIERDNDLQEALLLEYNLQAVPYIQSAVDFLSKVPGFEYIEDRNKRLIEIAAEQNSELEIGGVLVSNTISATRPDIVGSQGIACPDMVHEQEEDEEWES